MSTTSPHQLFLLADHLKLSLLERQRAVSLNLDPGKDDGNISRSLSSLQQGISALESQPQRSDDAARLRKQYRDLSSQFHGTAAPSSPSITQPNDTALQPEFTAVQSPPQSRPSHQTRRNKSVRFRDDPNAPSEPDAVETANRAALFADQDRYRDDPDSSSAPDHSALDNQQIHAYHKQVLRDQDAQLDSLGESVGRQRLLGIQMGDELDEQNELLEDVESGVDRHTSTLERAQKRLGHVARKSRDNWSWVTIGILIVILVLLIVVLN